LLVQDSWNMVKALTISKPAFKRAEICKKKWTTTSGLKEF